VSVALGREIRLLLVEDDVLQNDALAYLLSREGYEVEAVTSANECLERLGRGPSPHLVILDVSLPDLSGVELMRRLRSRLDVPVIMLTARAGEADVVVGLDAGADDYVTKPFSTHELLARIRARLRPQAAAIDESPAWTVGDLHIDGGTHEVRRGDERVALSAREFAILRILAEAEGRVVDRRTLFASVWGADYFGNDRVLDVYVRLLRQKIESRSTAPQYLHTVRGVGYRLAADLAVPATAANQG
jgi:two-component system response regulator RegX3